VLCDGELANIRIQLLITLNSSDEKLQHLSNRDMRFSKTDNSCVKFLRLKRKSDVALALNVVLGFSLSACEFQSFWLFTKRCAVLIKIAGTR
jgi:hypothetical protein